MSKALYRKYRPKTFDDLAGQEAVSTTLKRQVNTGRLSHAYLLCGTRGTGKTSTAKILAKAVNCISPEDGNPCCVCNICAGIEAESLLDVTEIDAASNSGVDNIRELREEAHFTPTVAKYRVYIIDETHMLSPGAFNALLKIMEEPPAHVLFILATTELHKVPATILSRCQRFDFHRLSSELIAERLSRVAALEEIDLDGEAAVLIAKLSDGGMRDALSLLDLVSAGGGPITAQTVRERVGLVGRDHLFSLAEAVASGDFANVLAVLQELWEGAIDYQRLAEQLIGFYRDLMVAKAVKEPGELIPCLPDELDRYKTLAAQHSMDRIMGWLSGAQEILIKMSRFTQRRAELEAGLLRMTLPGFGAQGVPDPELSRRVADLEKKIERPVTVSPPPKQAPPKADLPPPPPAEKVPLEPFDQWEKVLEALSKKNTALYGTLVGSTAYIGGDLMLVDAGPDSMFASMVRGDSYAKESLRAAAEAVTGKRYKLGPYNPERYEVKSKRDKLEEILKQAGALGVDVQIGD
ncbi:MAG: DNA polymerase III subunit gamma/tau [Oscillospiraceae bacterium]|nr:DNA polymerase III subunit gamma/tau [Oscillospiraceae bacterium]